MASSYNQPPLSFCLLPGCLDGTPSEVSRLAQHARYRLRGIRLASLLGADSSSLSRWFFNVLFGIVAFYIAEPLSGSIDSAEKCVDDSIKLSWDADHAGILSGVRHCDVTVRVSLSYFESEGTHARAFNCSSYRVCPERSW